ncbi:hypothetical protein [Gorillibacterium sp. sgz500922]|uniref:hypothetical protein n=1 Tax=Gorillibacterium sp. sgz500922 TaxID=3446694 RepID=UPI003F6791E3
MSAREAFEPLPAPPAGGRSLLLPLVRHNLRLIASRSWLAAPVLLALVAAASSPAFMGPPQAAFAGERLASLLGPLLLAPLALLDAGGIGETLLAKRRPHRFVFALRALLAAAYLAAVLAAFLGALRLSGADFAAIPLFAGVWADALALGSVALLAAVLFRGLPAGFILSFAWYLIDWTTKGKFTGPFYLFSMGNGEWNPDKLWLFGLALFAAACSVWLLPRNLGGEAMA